MPRKNVDKQGRISITGWIDEALKQRVAEFLERYPTVRSESTVVSTALLDYLEDAEKFGIDVNYRPKRRKTDRAE